MSAVILKIDHEILADTGTYIARVYLTMEDLWKNPERPHDTWEVSEIIVDRETLLNLRRKALKEACERINK